jgi:hypothetical protein
MTLTTPGTTNIITRFPAIAPVRTLALESSVATTLLAGFLQGIVILPGTFLPVLGNNSGAGLGSAGNCIVKYRTYNLNLNN